MDSSQPILDVALADQWFADDDDDQGKEDARRVVGMLRTDLEPRLTALCTNPTQLNAAAAEHEFHRIRGAVGSFGFARCAAHLLVLEKSWAELDDPRRNQELQAAHGAFTAGLEALVARFPHLAA
jgi:hypothetical protein